MAELPEQEESLAFARKIQHDLYEGDLHYNMPQEAWEKLVLDLLSLVNEARKDTGEPVPALPGTVRALLYDLQEIVMKDDAIYEGEVIVTSNAGVGERPIIEVAQANWNVELFVDGEFWDPEIHSNLNIDLGSPEIQDYFTPGQIKYLADLHAFNQDAETGRSNGLDTG